MDTCVCRIPPAPSTRKAQLSPSKFTGRMTPVNTASPSPVTGRQMSASPACGFRAATNGRSRQRAGLPSSRTESQMPRVGMQA